MTKWLLAAALSVLCARSDAATWNVFSDDSDGMLDRLVFFDADSVARKGDAVTVRFESLMDVEADPDSESYRTVTRRTFHCATGTVEAGGDEAFDWSGHATQRLDSAHPAAVPPRYSDEIPWLKDVCAATFPAPQARGDFAPVPNNEPAALALKYFHAKRAKFAAMNGDLPPQNPRAPREDCAGQHFSFAASTRQLPTGIVQVLEQRRGRMSDVGGPFNATDVVRDAAPMRRFAGAAVSGQSVFAAVEQGGIGYSIELWAFHRDRDRWTGKHLWHYAGDAPATLPLLLAASCRQYAPPPPRQAPKHPVVNCQVESDRSINVGYIDSETWFQATLNRTAVARGIVPRGRIVGGFANRTELTPEETAIAQTLLEAGRHSPDDHCPAATLDEFMQALAGREPARVETPHTPSRADALLATAKEAAKRGDRDAELAALDRACVVDPHNVEAFKARGDAYQFRHEVDKSLADYSTVLRLDPKQTQVRLDRAHLLATRFYDNRKAADRAAAASDLAVVDKELPPESDRRQSMAFMDGLLEMPAQELAQWNLWIPTHPGEGDYRGERCWARVRLGIQLPQALADCNALLQASPKAPLVHEYRGWLWLRLGKPDKAIADFERSLAGDANSDMSLYGRAVAHERLGDAAAAKVEFAKVRAKFLNVDSYAARIGLVPRSAIAEAQDRRLDALMARAHAQ